MSANRNTTAEVVVALDELAPQGALGVFDESQAQGFEIGEAALNRGLRIAARIAGYLAIAPQFFDRFEPDVALEYTPEGRQRAGEFLARADWNVALEDLQAARQSLRSFGTPKVGIVGFCWGGTLAWLLACRDQVDCAVAYYASEIDDFPNEHARHPVIMHIGDADRTIPPEKLTRIQKAQAGTPMYIPAEVRRITHHVNAPRAVVYPRFPIPRAVDDLEGADRYDQPGE